MEVVKLEDAVKFSNSSSCEVLEYPMIDKDINFSSAIIKGRYPEKGYCTNEECKELIYCIDGTGSLNFKNGKVVEFKKGDVILIDKKESYFWDANCKIVMPCAPAWYPEQHKFVD